jgi:hypothetical protein
MTTTYARTSPYFNTPVTGKYLDIAELPSIPKLVDDVLYTIPVVYENRPDLLAADLYNDPGLWWVFAARNPNIIQDPVFDIRPGYQIYIPRQANLKMILG